jgi:hypothetical protein
VVVPILLILLALGIVIAGFMYFRKQRKNKAFSNTGPVAFRSGTNVEFGGTGFVGDASQMVSISLVCEFVAGFFIFFSI